MAMSVVQGGHGFPFLAPPVYEYLVSGKCTGITVESGDVPDHTLQFVLNKVSFRLQIRSVGPTTGSQRSMQGCLFLAD